MRRLVKFCALPLPEQKALVEALICLAVARLMLRLPFRWLAPMVGRPHPSADCPVVVLGADERAAAFAVRHAILRVTARLPWHSTCLVTAIAARMMLVRRRLPAVLELGVRGGATRELSAHAWLKCGEIDVVGVKIAPQFTPLAAFRT
jgi:hypothetical protein